MVGVRVSTVRVRVRFSFGRSPKTDAECYILGEFSGRLSGRHNDIVGRYAGERWRWSVRRTGRQGGLGHRSVDHVTVSLREARLDGRDGARRSGGYT